MHRAGRWTRRGHRRGRGVARRRRRRGCCVAKRFARTSTGGRVVILVFDVGNTELTIGLFSESELRGHWRVMTEVARTPDEFGVLLRSLLAASEFASDMVESVAIGSVVPRVTASLAEGCAQYFTIDRPLIVDASAELPIRLDVEEPL